MLLVQGLRMEEQWCGKTLFNPGCKFDSPGPCRTKETQESTVGLESQEVIKTSRGLRE